MWLWRNGLSLAGLALLIGVSGLAFALALAPWQRLGERWSQRRFVQVPFALELTLVALVFAIGADGVAAAPLAVAVLLGIANGAYSAFFWTTQRVLFAASLGDTDAGRRYGNVQIFVTVLLKGGIVIGGLVLDVGGLGWLLLLSALVGGAAAAWLAQGLPDAPLLAPAATPLTATARPVGTRLAFLADGVFLLLESHFWTLSLFLMFGQDFARLGALVVALGIAFAILFWLTKNIIDRLPASPFYAAAVLLYAASWAMRAASDDLAATPAILPLLIVITFCSSLFRLTFNKRFFEHARQHGVTPYLVYKSRLSQGALGIAFLGIALALALGRGPIQAALDTTYLLGALLAFAYLGYAVPGARRTPDEQPLSAGARLGHVERAVENERTAEHPGTLRDA